VTLILGAAAVAWVALALALSFAMARRGYDRTSWLVVGLLFGPVAMLFAITECMWAIPRRTQILKRGHLGSGGANVLIVFLSSDLETAREATQRIGKRPGRLTFARVLPYDGAKEIEREAAARLRTDACALARPGAQLALLFGVPSLAIATFEDEGGFTVVVTDRPVAGLGSVLEERDVELLTGPEAVRLRFGSQGEAATRSLAGSSVSSARSAALSGLHGHVPAPHPRARLAPARLSPQAVFGSFLLHWAPRQDSGRGGAR
jgi:hypothetical protein